MPIVAFRGGRVVLQLPLQSARSPRELRRRRRTGLAEVRMTPVEAEDLGHELGAIAAGCFLGDA